MIGGRTVEGGGNDLALDRALHIGDLFGSLVHEHHHKVDLGVVGGDGVGDVLQGDGLTGLRRGDNQATLALADWGNDVHDTAGELVRGGLLLQTLLWVQRRELGELRTVERFFNALAVDGIDGLQRHELLALVATIAFARGANRTMDGIALAQAVLLDLAHGNVHVVRAGQVAGSAHKSVGVEHVDDAGHRHQILLRLFAAAITVIAIATIIAIIIATIIIGVVAITATHATVTAIAAIITGIAIVAIATVAAVTTHELVIVVLLAVFGRFLVLLRGQRGQDIVEVTHGFFAVFRSATTAARLLVLIITDSANQRNFHVLVTLAATLGRRCISQIERGQQIAGLIGLLARLAASEIGLVVIATTAGRTRFGCGIIGGLTTGASRFGLVLLGIVGHGKRQIELRFRGSRSRSRRLGGHVSIVCGVGLSGIGLRSLDDLGGFGGLGGAHGHTGRRLSTIARRLQGGEQLGLAHGRRAAQAHLFSELFELRQLHILKILAICHWLPFPYRTDPCLSRR